MINANYIHNVKYVKECFVKSCGIFRHINRLKKIIPFASLNASILGCMIKVRRKGEWLP